MLPKRERLCKRTDFEYIFKVKSSVATPVLVAYCTLKKDITGNELPKVGFIVGKKVHKKAAKRNKIKRHMREAYRNIRKSYPETITNFEFLIFIARPNILENNYFEIYDNIKTCIKKGQKFINKKLC